MSETDAEFDPTRRSRFFKGAALGSAIEWMVEEMGPEQVRRALEPVDPGLGVDKAVLPSSWYPVEALDALSGTYVEVAHGNDMAAARDDLRRWGGHVAEDNIGTFYKVAFALATETRMPFLFRVQWRIYFKPIQVETLAVGSKSASTRVRGAGNVRYLGIVSAGWKQYAYRMIAPEATVTERTSDAGIIASDELLYDYTW